MIHDLLSTNNCQAKNPKNNSKDTRAGVMTRKYCTGSCKVRL